MDIANGTDSHIAGVESDTVAPDRRARVLAPEGSDSLKEKNLKRIAKKNQMRERIIVDVIDEDITNVDTISNEEMEAYNKEYEAFMKRGRESMPINPVEKVMVANIEEYFRFSKDNHPAMVFFSEDLKIPLLTLDAGSEMRPHSDSTGIYYVIEGRGSIRIGMKNYGVSRGSLIHVPKGLVRSIHCEDTLKIMAIHVS